MQPIISHYQVVFGSEPVELDASLPLNYSPLKCTECHLIGDATHVQGIFKVSFKVSVKLTLAHDNQTTNNPGKDFPLEICGTKEAGWKLHS